MRPWSSAFYPATGLFDSHTSACRCTHTPQYDRSINRSRRDNLGAKGIPVDYSCGLQGSQIDFPAFDQLQFVQPDFSYPPTGQ
jgi:hypothetical protein